ncbi:uncharacterized protein LOC112550207 isoform X1 [Alligator sinensis]|uniref:Uncharacterized protein LOC112550207 isoform X1 n=1 Tax=Alligator sinensis TaxID=38654 RepID=A0A3Q0GHN3_ALLSI|nr:uncharacterized protein LOC112550207 isoform X1 [Alligator sinensis]
MPLEDAEYMIMRCISPSSGNSGLQPRAGTSLPPGSSSPDPPPADTQHAPGGVRSHTRAGAGWRSQLCPPAQDMQPCPPPSISSGRCTVPEAPQCLCFQDAGPGRAAPEQDSQQAGAWERERALWPVPGGPWWQTEQSQEREEPQAWSGMFPRRLPGPAVHMSFLGMAPRAEHGPQPDPSSPGGGKGGCGAAHLPLQQHHREEDMAAPMTAGQ